jgi:hypothetical protein
VTLVITPTMLENATASVVLDKISNAPDGYVPAPEERAAVAILQRVGLVYRVLDRQASSEGFGSRWIYFADHDERGNTE